MWRERERERDKEGDLNYIKGWQKVTIEVGCLLHGIAVPAFDRNSTSLCTTKLEHDI